MTTKATERPWKVETDDRIGPEITGVIGGLSTTIAVTYVDALNACKMWHQGDPWRVGDTGESKRWEAHRKTIDAALAQAKGE